MYNWLSFRLYRNKKSLICSCNVYISSGSDFSGVVSFLASIFGEFWKLEPLSKERKSRWQRELDWLLSPTNYMVELVPAKQNGANGRMLEVRCWWLNYIV